MISFEMVDKYSVIEWTIENFSCWNHEIHGNKISLQRDDLLFNTCAIGEIFLELFPRGVSGNEDNLVLSFCNWWFSGDWEVSFIDSEGSLIETESVNIKNYEAESYIGPMFEKVFQESHENKPFLKDSLTLRFRKNCVYFSVRHVRTIIDVFYTSIKLSSKTFFKDYRIENNAWNYISNIQYPLEDGKKQRLQFYAFKAISTPEAYLKFKLISPYVREGEILSRISLFREEGEDIEKYEEVEHIFTKTNEEISMEQVPLKDATEKEFCLLLCLKIITGKIRSHSQTSCYPCQIQSESKNSSMNPGTAATPHNDISVGVLTKELMCLYQDCDFSDFQLRCGQFSFAVHKGILSARSPVFKSMLTSDMREGVSNSVDIEDLDGPTLARFLAFLYSGKLDDVQWESAIKLYYAADKYQVPTLKRECATVLCDEISIANVCQVLSLGDKHEDDELTSVARGFILMNFNEVLKSKEWMDFISVDPTLLLKTITLFAQKDFVGKVKELQECFNQFH